MAPSSLAKRPGPPGSELVARRTQPPSGIERELETVRRRLDDHAAATRKNQLALSHLAESLAGWVANSQKRDRLLNLNSFVAYLLFTVLVVGGLTLLYRQRAGELAATQRSVQFQHLELKAKLDEVKNTELANQGENHRLRSELAAARADLAARTRLLAATRLGLTAPAELARTLQTSAWADLPAADRDALASALGVRAPAASRAAAARALSAAASASPDATAPKAKPRSTAGSGAPLESSAASSAAKPQ